MKEQTPEELSFIQDRVDITDLVDSRGWNIIDLLLKEKLSIIKDKMYYSDDPYVVMSCAKQIDGIMFIYDTIKDLTDIESRISE